MGDLDLHLELGGAGGLGRSLEAALRAAVRSGRLGAGTRLPGSRRLAADLGVARGTVVQAYTQLVAEGWLVGSPGSGTSVAAVPSFPSEPAAGDRGRAVARLDDLRPGRPDLGLFPRAAWTASLRRVIASAEASAFDYGPPVGMPELRAAVAGYLARTRGVDAGADAVMVTAGFGSGLALLGRALHRSGLRRVATEHPGFARHRALLLGAGLQVEPLTVDGSGAVPDDLRVGAGLAVLTPAHQHPCGVVLAPGRRAAFLDWARRNDAYLVEDDYDGEFRYDQKPVGALQALDPDRVIYAGTTSKALAPGIRLGWLVVPAALRGPLMTAVEETGTTVPVLDQLALADLIERGGYDRQIRQARQVYRTRRTELARRLAPLPLAGVAAGLHALLPVGSVDRERALVAAAERAGLRLHGLHTSGYWTAPDDDGRAALVLGYATPPAHSWRRVLDALATVVGLEMRAAGTDAPG